MTELQVAVESAYENKYGTTIIGFGKKGMFPVEVGSLTDEQIVVLLYHGKGKFNDQWNSSEEKKENIHGVAQFWKGWLDRMVTTKTRGQGTVDVPNQKAWLMFYQLKGTKVNNRAVTGKTLKEAQLADCKVSLINKDPSLLTASNLNEQVEAVLPAWITEQEQDMVSVGGFIALQEAMESKTMA